MLAKYDANDCLWARAVADDFRRVAKEFAATCRFLGEAPTSQPEEVFLPLASFLKEFDIARAKVCRLGVVALYFWFL